jgi:hypothetical protein
MTGKFPNNNVTGYSAGHLYKNLTARDEAVSIISAPPPPS